MLEDLSTKESSDVQIPASKKNISFLIYSIDIVVKAKKRKVEGEKKKIKKHKPAGNSLVSY